MEDTHVPVFVTYDLENLLGVVKKKSKFNASLTKGRGLTLNFPPFYLLEKRSFSNPDFH